MDTQNCLQGGQLSVAVVRKAKSSAPTKANTITKPATMRGCMRLRSHANNSRLRVCAAFALYEKTLDFRYEPPSRGE